MDDLDFYKYTIFCNAFECFIYQSTLSQVPTSDRTYVNDVYASIHFHLSVKHYLRRQTRVPLTIPFQNITRRVAYNEEKSVATLSGRYPRLDAMVYWCALCKDTNTEIITIACLPHDLRSRYKWNAYENTPRCPHPRTAGRPRDALQHSLGPDPICMIMKNEKKGKHANPFHPEAAASAQACDEVNPSNLYFGGERVNKGAEASNWEQLAAGLK